MARAPFQVLIIPYRFRTDGEVEVAVFHRHDGSMWQFLAGGIEWLTYEDASHKLTWDSNRTALWELRERLKHRWNKR